MCRRRPAPGQRPTAPKPRRVVLWVLLGLLGLLCLFAWAPATAGAQQSSGSTISREYTIKAGYLYNFGRYVRWPEEAFSSEDAPFVIGVLGADPFGATLDQVAAVKQISERRIVVRRFDSLDQYRPCHILFVAKTASAEEHFEAIRRLRATMCCWSENDRHLPTAAAPSTSLSRTTRYALKSTNRPPSAAI